MEHHINIEEIVQDPVQMELNKIHPELVQDINEKVRHLPPLHPGSCIYRVNEGLRKSNRGAYTPMLVSIGPYHHGKPSLHGMEEHKLRYLHSLLERRKENSVEKYISTLANLEDKAREYYADPIHLKSDEFVKMMLLDGFFIIEFVRKDASMMLRHEDDPLFDTEWMKYQIRRDMILLENQLPFFVLSELYDMTKDPEQNIASFVNSAESAFINSVPNSSFRAIVHDGNDTRKIKHLLDLVRNFCCPQSVDTSSAESVFINSVPNSSFRAIVHDGNDTHKIKHLLDLVCNFCCPRSVDTSSEGSVDPSSEGNTGCDMILSQLQSVIELQESGVKFKKVGDIDGDDLSGSTISLFDVKFNNGVMEIPCFKVEDSTETFFRNMIAYEQHSSDVKLKYFSDYASIMDELINSEEDAKLLRLCGIIRNMLSDDKEVSNLFNNLGKGVVYSSSFYYFEMCDQVNNHCEKTWNVVMAKLRRDYFNNPWSGISTVAAALLLIFTLVQMIAALIPLLK